jgi:hypothetical protein
MSDAEQAPTEGAAKPSPAGMYDCYLGGTANTAADREAVARVMRAIPEIKQVAWANRGFLLRAVTWLAQECGIRQFIDIGAGLPTQKPTHEVARGIIPGSRVVYTDNDARVVARGHEILRGVAGTAVIEADLRQPRALLDHPETRRLIDFAEPVGLLMIAVTQFVADADDPWRSVSEYADALVPGSYLALSAPTADNKVSWRVDKVVDVYATSTIPVNVARTKPEIERFFEGMQIVPPYEGAGPVVVHVGLWGAEDPESADDDGSRWFYAAVARKP